jgi:hypothetical protein
VLRRAERGLPDLHGVHARGLGGVGAEDDHPAVVEDAVAVTLDGRLHLLADEVVGQQRVAAALALVEHVEHVFAVGRAHRGLELEARGARVEDLVVPRLQVVATGEHHAVPLGQLPARLPNGVEPHHPLRARVVHQEARPLLAEGVHAQEDQVAHLRVAEVGVVQRLVHVVHRLAVDAAARGRVVLHLHGEVPVRGLHEDGVEDVEVRVRPADLCVPPRHHPLEVVRLGEDVVALSPVVQVAHRTVGLDAPAQHLHVARAGPHLDHREQLARGAPQLDQARVAVVAKQLSKVGAKARVLEQLRVVATGWHVAEVITLRALLEAVQREHVLHLHLLLELELHGVAEQEPPAHLHDVARHAGVLRAHAHLPAHLEGRAPEGGHPLRVERVEPAAERRPLLGEALADDLVVGAALGRLFRVVAHARLSRGPACAPRSAGAAACRPARHRGPWPAAPAAPSRPGS